MYDYIEPVKEAEGGGPGTEILKSYTYFLFIAAYGAFFWFARQDIKKGGPRHLTDALGIETNTWIIIYLIAAGFVFGIPQGLVAGLYYQYTGQRFENDRLGFAKSGGVDICFWSAFFVFLIVLYLFTYVVPPLWFGNARPFVIFFFSLAGSLILASKLARRVFTALYGPPRFRSR